MKKIIFIHLLNDLSGSPKVLSQVIKSCQGDSNIELELYASKSENGFLNNVVPISHFYCYKNFKNKYLTLISYVLSQVYLFFKLLKYRNQNVKIYINTLLPFGAALAGKLLGKPVYYHVQETHIKPKLFYNFLCAIVQRTASEIIFVSKYVKDAQFYAAVNQTVVYNALPNDFYLEASESQYQHLDDNGKFNVLMICSLKSYKGVEEFVKIANSCQIQPSINFSLILNATKKEIDNYFSAFIIPSNLTFVDRQKNLYPYYTKASLLLNLSRIDEWVETFGLTILEAMAFGVPIIVPPVGGPLELITEGVEGFLISSYNVDEITHKIIELSADKKQCMKLSKNAVKRAKTFNEKTFEKNILEILQK